MNNITTQKQGVSSVENRANNKTENGTKIVMPGQEADKDIFLKMLVAQMTNQDPMNPQDPTQYITQMAQFSMLEQMMSFNDGMEHLLAMENGVLVNSALSTASSLIGKNVEVFVPTEGGDENTKTEGGAENTKTEGGAENTETEGGAENTPKTCTGYVESVHVKDGIVYLDIRLDETGETKSFEYGSIKKISENNINLDKKGE